MTSSQNKFLLFLQAALLSMVLACSPGKHVYKKEEICPCASPEKAKEIIEAFYTADSLTNLAKEAYDD